jgi:hypothetical protein
MRSTFSRRTRLWPAGAERNAKKKRGAVSLVVLFLLFIFSGLGLSMIYLSQAHLKMNAYRKFSVLLDYASENGLKRGLEDLEEWLLAKGPSLPVSDGRYEDFRTNPAAAFPELIEDALGPAFPRHFLETSAGATWESVATCGLHTAEDRGTYVRIRAGLIIESNGGLERLRPKRFSSLEADLGILAGRLPLPAIPLLINKQLSQDEKGRFLEENSISFVTASHNPLEPRTAAFGEGVIPRDATPAVAKALDIRLFKPQDLTAAKLRSALGLEPSLDPVPDGVYLIKTDLGLGGVFVQGDVQEMVLAIEADTQVIVFRLEAGEWDLRFSPSRSHTEFRTPEAVFTYDYAPLGIIIANGKIESLGGGVGGGDGAVAMVKDREVPSILNGVSLTIVSSDKITLSSHLILQGVRWQEGIPYIKESQSQLVIFSTGRDFLSQAELEGGVAVDSGAPDSLKLHASLTSGSRSFEIGGSGKTVEILGALHADDYKGNGNSLRVVPDERLAAGDLSTDAPVTATPQFCVYSLRITAWKEHE